MPGDYAGDGWDVNRRACTPRVDEPPCCPSPHTLAWIFSTTDVQITPDASIIP
jgi:hypothetical protein